MCFLNQKIKKKRSHKEELKKKNQKEKSSDENVKKDLNTNSDLKEEATSLSKSIKRLSNQDKSEVKNFKRESTRVFHQYGHSNRNFKRETVEAPFTNAGLNKNSKKASLEALRAKGYLVDKSIEALFSHANPKKNSKEESTKASSIQVDCKKEVRWDVYGVGNNLASENQGGYVTCLANGINTTNVLQAKIVSPIHRSGRGKEAFFGIAAGWNWLGVNLKNRGVLWCVKYINNRAKSDR